MTMEMICTDLTWTSDIKQMVFLNQFDAFLRQL